MITKRFRMNFRLLVHKRPKVKSRIDIKDDFCQGASLMQLGKKQWDLCLNMVSDKACRTGLRLGGFFPDCVARAVVVPYHLIIN